MKTHSQLSLCKFALRQLTHPEQKHKLSFAVYLGGVVNEGNNIND
jgi:hypothetical protein